MAELKEFGFDKVARDTHGDVLSIARKMSLAVLELRHELEMLPTEPGNRLIGHLNQVADGLVENKHACEAGLDLLSAKHMITVDAAKSDIEFVIDAYKKKIAEHDFEVSEFKKRIAKLEWRLRGRQEHKPTDPKVRAKVLSLTDGKCAYCGSAISDQQDDGTSTFAVEHVVPKSCGGPDHITNFVPACSSCNSQKASGHVIEFIRKQAGKR